MNVISVYFSVFAAILPGIFVATNVDQEPKPILMNSNQCIETCGQAGLCESFCGPGGYCCRHDFGECLKIYEDVAPITHHACIKGSTNFAHENARQFESCKIDILPGSHIIKDNTVFGTLSVLPDEFSISFGFQALVSSSDYIQYLLLLHSKASRGKGIEFKVFGDHGRYTMMFCGTLSGSVSDHQCYDIKKDLDVNDKIHVHMHQTKDVNDIYHQEIYVDHQFVSSGVNPEGVVLHNVSIVGVVLPKQTNAGRLENIHLGVCNGTFDRTEKET